MPANCCKNSFLIKLSNLNLEPTQRAQNARYMQKHDLCAQVESKSHVATAIVWKSNPISRQRLFIHTIVARVVITYIQVP